MTKRVLVTAAYLAPGDGVDRLLGDAGYEAVFATPARREASGLRLRDVVADVDGIVAGTDAFTAEVLGAAPKLKVIGRCGAGYDNIDVDAATRNGVAVTFTPGANRRSVAEHVLALMLNCARGIPQNIASIHAGGWEQRSGRELEGATLGVIGLGSIGKTVARLGLALGMRVIAFDREPVHENGVAVLSFDEVLRQSDFLSLHIFLSPATRHLIDATALRMMKPASYLINTARGEVVDEDALADALAKGELAGAALDVLREEPLPATSKLRELDNVIVTAHIAAATVEARSRSSLMATQQVIDVLDGRTPKNLVNHEVI
ncbi:phosphoglycerate dehydrogenase [Kibdelosporangium phytohabitans]|uniref:Phosphoglycerate dehydrogenase n=1 Tax=Kibdelosporangium phytohabitans TaxID=860235 RepID=A0A0N7F4V9_9PSEU|nr:phosphoglycerate dehydrogenase [Kibdelosporangium phytohabitans]ALG12519.1 phosphoglycerate dehydrogenase [Kibdelosporangium phytohabitans]MBE1464122.1 phosphoglycerate dehydrogenase-like enzyme [Kibdelosporangium phytohabitans]